MNSQSTDRTTSNRSSYKRRSQLSARSARGIFPGLGALEPGSTSVIALTNDEERSITGSKSEAPPDRISVGGPSEEPELESDYPSGFKLLMILIALNISIFLISLDNVSKS
jgi:hypothetical protein